MTAFTHASRETPLEPLTRPIIVSPGRRLVTTRLQVGAAAAIAVAALSAPASS